jgi:hypothetical protein
MDGYLRFGYGGEIEYMIKALELVQEWFQEDQSRY